MAVLGPRGFAVGLAGEGAGFEIIRCDFLRGVGFGAGIDPIVKLALIYGEG